MVEKFDLVDLNSVKKFAKLFAENIESPFCCYLNGNLGAGKTTLVQYILKSLGVTDIVVSPTFTIIERYSCDFEIFHIDLYRIDSPNELEYTDIPELINNDGVFFIEWAENGDHFIPLADLIIEIMVKGCRRQVLITARSLKATHLLTNLLKNVNNEL